jgi:hypothetical protein
MTGSQVMNEKLYASNRTGMMSFEQNKERIQETK